VGKEELGGRILGRECHILIGRVERFI